MAKLLMSKRGVAGSAHAPTYDQLELGEGWREWENTKQELVLVKRQLAEKDELVLQLKTATRRLHEMLRKKEKDLQAVFAVLRSPQDAETTKTRRKELIERLVAESLHRAMSAETLAEERKRDLDHLKFSSKFLHFQELELEVEECHIEIERLRAKIDAQTAGFPALVSGKLRISALPVVSEQRKAQRKKSRPTGSSSARTRSRSHKGTVSVATESSAIQASPNQATAGQVRVMAAQTRSKRAQREGFVTKTRRRAVEADYYKQVRLAQLEAECELEENLHIRAAREAKKVQLAEQKQQQLQQKEEAVRVLREALQFAEGGEGDPGTQQGHGIESPGGSNGSSGVSKTTPTVQKEEKPESCVDIRTENYASSASIANITDPEGCTGPGIASIEAVATGHDETTRVVGQNGEDNGVNVEGTHAKMKMYEDDDFDDDEEDNDNVEDDGPSHDEAEGYNRAVWNLDPSPSAQELPLAPATAHDAEAERVEDDGDPNDSERKIWNLDPSPSGQEQPLVPATAHDAEAERVEDDGDPNDSERKTWNLDPSPPVPESATQSVLASPDAEGHRRLWNLDSHTNNLVVATAGDDHSYEDEEDRVVWNADPNPVDAISTPLPCPSTSTVPPHKKPSGAEATKWSPWNLDPRSPGPESTTSSNESQETSTDWKVWNADPNPSAPGTCDQPNGSGSIDVPVEEHGGRKVWNLDPNPLTGEEIGRSASGRIESSTTDDDLERRVWNLDPNPSTSEKAVPSTLPSEHSKENVTAAEEIELGTTPVQEAEPQGGSEQERNVWNLDPSPEASTQVLSGEWSARGSTTKHDAVWNADPSPTASAASLPKAGEGSPDKSNEVVPAAWNLDPNSSKQPLEPPERTRPHAKSQEASDPSPWNASMDDKEPAEPPNLTTCTPVEKEKHGLLDRAASTIQRWWGQFTSTITGESGTAFASAPDGDGADLPPSEGSPVEDAEADVATGEQTPEYSYTPDFSPRDDSDSDGAPNDEEEAAW